MAVPEIISANRRQYLVVEDTICVQLGLLEGRIRDAITGGPPLSPVRVETDHPGLFIRVQQNRWFGISGSLELAFPNLSVQSDVVHLTVTAPGYQAVQFSVVIPQNAAFPITSPEVRLLPEPVVLEGRVTSADTSRAPVPDALVRTVDPPGPSPTDHIHLLRRPVQIDRSTGAVARSRILNGIALPGQRSLVSQAPAGARALMVNNRQGLAAGQILRLGTDRNGEYAVVANVSSVPANLSLPGLVNLEGGLQTEFPAQTGILAFTGGATGAPLTLNQPALAGTSVIVLDGVFASGVMELSGSGQPPEYHLIGGLTDAAGYYRVPGLGSASLLHLDASASGFSPLAEPVAWMVLYDKPVNRVDFRLAP